MSATITRSRTPPPGSPAWQAQHRLAMFATDAAPAAGLSRFGDPFSTYLEKLGLTAPKLQTEAMKWGALLERVIGRQWASDRGVVARPDSWTYWRRDLPYPAGTHLDFRTGEGDLVEIKTASIFSAGDFGESGSDEVPIDYRLQCAHELLVTDAARCHLVVLIGGNRLAEYRIERDPVLEEQLVAVEARAWRQVQERQPPPMDGSDGASEYLRKMYPSDDGSTVELSEEVQGLAVGFITAKEQEKAAKGQIEALRNQIAEALGSASAGQGGDISVTWRKSRDSAVTDWERVARTLAPDPESLADAISANTSIREGPRPLLVKYLEGTA